MTLSEQIQDDIKSNSIILYMKGNKQMPMCGFSSRVVHILNDLGVKFFALNIFEDPELMQQIKEYSDWPTTPQIYVEGKLIGGCDIIEQLAESGKLKDILKV